MSTQRKPSRCSLCCEPGHNIIKCSSPLFGKMEVSFQTMMNEYQVSFPTYYLMKFYIHLQNNNNFGMSYEQFLMHIGVIINKKMNVEMLTMYNINKAILCIVKYYSEFNV